jgi:hypothetical protein
LSTWKVIINDVDVGTLADDRYQAICSSVNARKLLYLQQAWNFVYSTLNLYAYLLVTLLAGVVLMTGYCLYFAQVDPAVLAHYTASPTSMVKDWFAFVFLMSFLMIVLVPFSFQRRMFGYRNLFTDQIWKSIRQELSIPHSGTMVLTREPQSANPITDAKEGSNLS